MSFRIRRFDGVYRWFKTRAVPLRDPAGRILKWFGSNTDIEDFVVAERQAQGAARAHAAARSHHARDRRSPGTAQGVRSRAAQPRGQSRHRFRAASASTRPNPSCSPSAAWANAARALGAAKSASSSRRSIEVDENGLQRCVRGELVYEPDIEPAQFPFPARLATGGLRSLVAAPLHGRETRCSACWWSRKRARRLASAATTASSCGSSPATWRWPRTRRGSTTRCRAPTRICARRSRP